MEHSFIGPEELNALLESESILEKYETEVCTIPRPSTLSQACIRLKQVLRQIWSFPSLRVLAGFLKALLPSLWFKVREERKRSIRKTAYLDGLRGCAALLVYAVHHQAYSHSGGGDSFESVTEKAFGYKGNYYFSTLPLIRLFFSGGHFAVALFFVISGYALSIKPLKLVHDEEIALFAKSVGSALSRRWLRLYIPVFATTFIFMTSWHILGIQSSKWDSQPPEQTYLQEIWKWTSKSATFSYLFSDTIRNPYNLQMWSIPIEFRGSIVVYSALLAFFQCEKNIRLAGYAILIFYFVFAVDGCANAFFVFGTLLCDIDILSAKGQLPRVLSWSIRGWMYYIPLLIGLYLAGVPTKTDTFEELQENPGWYALAYLKPAVASNLKQYYFFWASAMVMPVIPRISWIRFFFETTFCQYVGKISFGFYLIHGPVLFTIGARLYAAVGRDARDYEKSVAGWANVFPVTSSGPLNLEINNIVPHLILLPLTLWLGELVTRFIDDPWVRFLQWLFKRSMALPGSKNELP